jgi:hypothetical protein
MKNKNTRPTRGQFNILRFIIKPAIQLAGIGGFAYCLTQAFREAPECFSDVPRSGELIVYGTLAIAALAFSSMLLYIFECCIAPESLAVFLGCYTHESDRKLLIGGGVTWKNHYNIRYVTFQQPDSGSRVESVVCHRCGKAVQLEVWSLKAVLFQKFIAIVILTFFLGVYFAPVNRQHDQTIIDSLLMLAKVFVVFSSLFIVPCCLVCFLNGSFVWSGFERVSGVSNWPSSNVDESHQLFHKRTKPSA